MLPKLLSGTSVQFSNNSKFCISAIVQTLLTREKDFSDLKARLTPNSTT